MRRLMPSKQTGFSLVELLIAGVLGLILIGGVIQLFLGSNRNFQMQDDLASLQEDGRFALMFLSDQIEMGGFTDPNVTGVEAAIDLNNSADGVTDTIAVTSVQQVNGINNLDCNGNAVGNGVVTNQFSVNGNNELICRGVNGGGAGQPLISGVANFQVLYGVETDAGCPDGVVDRYMTRDEIAAANLGNNVLSVKVAILLASDDNLLDLDMANTYQVADQNQAFNDRRVRRLFQETIFMPNSAYNVLVNSNAAVRCMSGI